MRFAPAVQFIRSEKFHSWFSMAPAILLAVVMPVVTLPGAGCGNSASSYDGALFKDLPNSLKKEVPKKSMDGKTELRLATFGNGCFWCSEAIFRRLNGVEKVMPGYSGGKVDNPTYEQVCTGTTGHAESIQITYDPAKVSYGILLEAFWKTHDPTTKNRQGNDVGPQYRSVVFYHDTEQKKLAESYKARLEAEKIWDRPIVTEIAPLSKFWPAEDYHQNYYNNHPSKGYCTLVITPKIEKFKIIFKDRLKPQ
jgi:peptide-methionine (S)-S-oxide reductase